MRVRQRLRPARASRYAGGLGEKLEGVRKAMVALPWKESMGLLSVILALVAFGIYGWQTMIGRTRPHPLSWLLFGVLSGTGYLIQRDQHAGAGSWALLTMTVLCLVL